MDNKQIIEDLLKSNPRGLTIQEISDKSNLSRITAANKLAELKGADEIEVRKIGQAKLHYWKKKSVDKQK